MHNIELQSSDRLHTSISTRNAFCACRGGENPDLCLPGNQTTATALTLRTKVIRQEDVSALKTKGVLSQRSRPDDS